MNQIAPGTFKHVTIEPHGTLYRKDWQHILDAGVSGFAKLHLTSSL